MSGQDQIRQLTADMVYWKHKLDTANAVALAALERAKKLQAEVDRMQPEFDAIIAVNEGLQAEVAAWRRAVRWRKANRWELRLWTKTGPIELGTVREGMPSIGEPDGWVAEADDLVPVTGLPDRNAACTRVCELLGIPVVLP